MKPKMHFKDMLDKHSGKGIKSQNNSFLKLIDALNKTCLFFGVSPILDSSHGKRHAVRCLHFIWCAIFVIYIFGVNVYYVNQPHEPLVNIVKLFLISELFSQPLIVCLIVVTIYYHAEQYRNIPRELLRIHKHYKSLCPTNAHLGKELFSVLHKEVWLLLTIVCPFILCCFIVDCLRTHPDFVHCLLSLSAYHLPNLLITLCLGQYWLALRYLCQLYRGFNELLKLRLQQISSTNSGGDGETTAGDAYASEFSWYQREFYNTRAGGVNECKLLKAIRGPYGDLDALRAQLTSLFGIILLLIFLSSLLSLSVECFAVYKFLDSVDVTLDKWTRVYQRLMNILIYVGRIFLILVTNNTIIEEKCQTSLVLNELHITSKEMEHEVNRFLLQLMVQQPAEMVCGIVDLDLLALGGIVGIVANYIIFLIQIDLDEVTMEKDSQTIKAKPGDRFSL